MFTACGIILNFLDRFSKNPQTLNLMKIRLVGAEFYHVDRRTNGWIDGNDEASFRNFSKAPENETE